GGAGVLRDGARQGRIRLRRGEGLDEGLRAGVLRRRARAPSTRVQRRAIGPGHFVDPEDPALSRGVPGAGETHTLDVKKTVGVDPDGRTEVDRTAVEDPAANEPAGWMTVRPAEEVAVHSGDGCFGGHALLHRRDALAAEDRI